MKHIFKTLFIHPDNDNLNYRLFNGVCFFSTLVTFSATTVNISLSLPLPLTLMVIFSGLCYLIFFLISRFKGSFTSLQPMFILLSLSLLSVLWFYTQGLTGSTPIFYVFLTFTTMFIIDKKYHLYLGIGLSLNILALIYLEVHYPQWMIPYIDISTQKWDLGSSYITVVLLVGGFASFLKSHYNYERDRANEAIQYKAQFLANMSHELRTPLNSLIGFTNILKKNKTQNMTHKQLNYLDRMHFNGNHLLELVNDILDISKLESGQVQVYSEEIHLPSFLTEITKQFEPQIKSKGLTLLTHIPGGIEPLNTDAGKLKQILINLLSNAIKFTHQGEVTLSVESNGHDQASKISVSDTGLGIPKNKQHLIFETFVQLDNSTKKNHGGTGLGLAISKKLSELLGFELVLKSEEDKGSHFSIVIH